jgi:hypothetical protein
MRKPENHMQEIVKNNGQYIEYNSLPGFKCDGLGGKLK